MKSHSDSVILEELALVVHGIALSLNILGFVFNIRKKSWVDVSIHLASGTYHAVSTYNHYKKSTEMKMDTL